MTEEQAETVYKQDIERLNAMVGYCKTAHCLREYILRYFGTNRYQSISGKYCGNCSACMRSSSRAYEQYGYGNLWEDDSWDGGYGSDGEEYGSGTAGRYCAGYRVGSSYFAGAGVGSVSGNTAGYYGTGLYGGQNQSLFKAKNHISALDENQQILYSLLKGKRREIAEEEGVPPYMVFTDRTLLDMCVKCPGSREEMLKVSGVGENKYGRYGSRFLKCIRDFQEMSF